MIEETPQSAREQIEAYRGRLDETMIATALELLRSIQGVGPRRHPGGGFVWQEPEVDANAAGGLALVWEKPIRTLFLVVRKGDPDSIYRVFLRSDAPASPGQDISLEMAVSEVVQFLSDGRD